MEITMAEQATLQSGIMRHYHGRFVVDEDALRRIQLALTKGAASLSFETYLVFRVYREDDRFYETTDLADVLSDANLPGKRVQHVVLELRRVTPTQTGRPWEERWIVEVTFSAGPWYSYSRYYSQSRLSEEGAALTVITQDRNWALLMADELEPQVQRALVQRRMTWLMYPVVVVALVVIAAIGEILKAPGEGVSTLLRPYTMWKISIGVPFGIGLVWLYRWIPFRLLLPPGLGRWFSGESVFLWGEELKQYPQRQRFRSSILWSVVVAFVVSLVASLVAWVLTSGRPSS
jgi:hypothetical protein